MPLATCASIMKSLDIHRWTGLIYFSRIDDLTEPRRLSTPFSYLI